MPARGAEEGDRIGTECLAAGRAFNRQHEPEGLAAPSEKSILSVFTEHRKGNVPTNVWGLFIWESRASVKVVAL